jgi:enterochelin esterase-like enzyme
MDNLIAAHQARPFIIVMTYGMTNDVRPGGLFSFDIHPFETVLVKELIPYVDGHFRTLADRTHRAMAGLSMGGFETKAITLANLDKFAYVGLFSGGTFAPEDVSKTPGFRDKVEIDGNNRAGPGGGDRPDVRGNAEALKKDGINSVFYVSPNTAHEFLSWRRSLHEFAPLLFKD